VLVRLRGALSVLLAAPVRCSRSRCGARAVLTLLTIILVGASVGGCWKSPRFQAPFTLANPNERHPIAVMIDDLSAARPQSGLQSASIVWHAPAEGGIPRYMAIFQETLPEDVGPVRSARQYYIAWAAEWKAVYVHAGGSPQALATLAAKGRGQYVYNADEFRYSKYFRRVSNRFPPHNLYTTLANLRKLSAAVGAERGPLEAAWTFAPDIPLEQRPEGGSISVSYRSRSSALTATPLPRPAV